MNPYLSALQPYPFQRLNTLLADIHGPDSMSPILLSLGEPKHGAPEFIIKALTDIKMMTGSLGTYPSTQGIPELRQAISDWILRRFNLPAGTVNPDNQVLPVSGTREALFSFAQAVLSRDDEKNKPLVLMPNPFYQIYEGASLLGGATPVYISCMPENNYHPDFDSVAEDTWRRCQLLYICTPGNPTGAVLDKDTLVGLIDKAMAYDFVIASDECYSEVYYNEQSPPIGLLEACHACGHSSFKRCVVFNSLSKRSNLPGLRSGFVAGDQDLITQYLLYRTYHGAASPLHTQLVSTMAWSDEKHVVANRALYRQKMEQTYPLIKSVLEVTKPEAGFYLWPKVPETDEDFTVRLFASQNVEVLPGSYLARTTDNFNPGQNRVRMALVATLEDCLEAARRINNFMDNR